MRGLIDALAHLCSLRDRAALDAALVSVVSQAGEGLAKAVRLIRLVGDERQLHCLIRAEKQFGKDECERLPAWVDWKDLPPLSHFAARLQAFEQGAIVRLGRHSHTLVIPVGHAAPPLNFLEIDSAESFPENVLQTVRSIIRLYENFEGLLDYGEKDALTELLNRKTFDGAFAKMAIAQTASDDLAHADRRSFHAAETHWLAVLDIDHFKRVNDNYGHLIGDEVLLLMARLMRTSFRFHDQLYRFGGEEFVILMRCAGHDDAFKVLERFRNTVLAFEFPQVGAITVSIGFAQLRSDDTPGGAFDRADKAVYWAKGHGRNQVCSYQQLLERGDLVEEVDASQDVDFF